MSEMWNDWWQAHRLEIYCLPFVVLACAVFVFVMWRLEKK